MSSTDHIIELPNRWGRRYRVVHLGTRDPEVFAEVVTPKGRRVWSVLSRHAKHSRARRAEVLAHIEGRAP